MILYAWKYNNGTFTRTAVIDTGTSVIWVSRFYAAGEFELYIHASDELLELFSGETFLTRDDSETTMIVEKILLTTDAENGDYLTISGRSAEAIIGRRIVPKQTNLDSAVEYGIRRLMTENVINPTNTARKIPFITLEASHDWTEQFQRQITGKNLLDSISDICKTYEYGFRMVFNGTGFEFQLYKGVDRTISQTENNRVIFSPQYENLGNTTYNVDNTTFYNSVYVAGEGEGTARTIVNATTPNASGLNLFEKWIDARQSSSNNGEISASEYETMLQEQGAEEIGVSKVTKEFGGEIVNRNVFVYGVDYNLGDKVSIVNEYGVTGSAIVTEITEVEDDSGIKLVPTLSEWETE